jgi:hypothetical protein
MCVCLCLDKAPYMYKIIDGKKVCSGIFFFLRNHNGPVAAAVRVFTNGHETEQAFVQK